MEVFILDLSLSLIVTFKRGFKGRFMFSFHVGPNLDILFEKLTAQIVTRMGLGTLLCFEAPGDLRVDIVKMQRSKAIKIGLVRLSL